MISATLLQPAEWFCEQRWQEVWSLYVGTSPNSHWARPAWRDWAPDWADACWRRSAARCAHALASAGCSAPCARSGTPRTSASADPSTSASSLAATQCSHKWRHCGLCTVSLLLRIDKHEHEHFRSPLLCSSTINLVLQSLKYRPGTACVATWSSRHPGRQAASFWSPRLRLRRSTANITIHDVT